MKICTEKTFYLQFLPNLAIMSLLLTGMQDLDYKFSLNLEKRTWTVLVLLLRAVHNATFAFSFLSPVFVTYIKSSYKLLLCCEDLRSRNFQKFWQRESKNIKMKNWKIKMLRFEIFLQISNKFLVSRDFAI